MINNLFFNWLAEIDLLQQNMLSGIHTTLYAPKRYDKSSLGHVVLTRLDNSMLGIYVNIFLVTSIEDLAKKLYLCILNVLGRSAVDKISFASCIVSFFKHLQLSLLLNPATNTLEFSVSLGNVPALTHIETIIGGLDQYCTEQRIKVCFILDEFQQICELPESRTLEEILRKGLYSAKNLSFLMMGSQRLLLRDMFESRKRPLYRTAKIMSLPKIPETEFADFLVKTFKKGIHTLSPDEAKQIVEYCDAFPYYVQNLSMILLDLKSVKGGGMDEAKARLIASETFSYENIFLSLTIHQKRLLKAIAKVRPVFLYTYAFIGEHRLGSLGGVQNSIAKLKSFDLVEHEEGRWKVVDPIFEKWLVDS